MVDAADADKGQNNSFPIRQWRGKTIYKKVVRIDYEYLMFRIENSRTEIQQLAYIRKNALPKDYFNDPESVQSQQSQEAILLDMIKRSDEDIVADLEKRKQQDPCIITYDGFLVNGNRRTAALKTLGERYIDCVVLPLDTTPKDIYSLEQQLQISYDFREKYHWINELKNIRKGLEDERLELTEKELADNLGITKIDLQARLRMLVLIDAFLFWRNIDGQYDYHKLNDTKEIFQQLEKETRKFKSDPEKRTELQNAVFTLIEIRPTKGRLYNHVMSLFREFESVYEKMADQTPQETEPKPVEIIQPEVVFQPFVKPYPAIKSKVEVESGNQESNLFDILIDSDISSKKPLFDFDNNIADKAEKLTDAIADAQAEKKEKQNNEAAFEGISTALRELQGLVINEDTAKIEGIRNKLSQIIETATSLLSSANSI